MGKNFAGYNSASKMDGYSMSDYSQPELVAVIGSGFGGSVAALRLREKGYRVILLEAGRRFEDQDHARTSWDLRRFLWAPRLGCYGVQRIHRLPDVIVLAGAGVGGGSLNYANTLYVPPPAFFADPHWAELTDWADELKPHYATAKRMLGVVQNPCAGPVEEIMHSAANKLGVGNSFTKTPVGVFFGKPGVRVPDPFFNGAGPHRTGCTQCGNCMVGCRVGAKNTLAKNYLALAQKLGVEVQPMRTVVDVFESDQGFIVRSEKSGTWLRKQRVDVKVDQVVFAAGAWGTQGLLHRLKTSSLPKLSDRLGWLTRTNSEAILGATTRRLPKIDLTHGVAITTSFHLGDTHIENCRYGKGSNAMGLLGTILIPGGGQRAAKFLATALKHPLAFGFSLWPRRFSERTVIGLVMQSLDNSLTVSARQRRVLGRVLGWMGFHPQGLTSSQGHGQPNPTWIPQGHKAIREIAQQLQAKTGLTSDSAGTIGELLNMPLTAHFIGGCVLGDSPETGVVDAYHRVFGYPGLHIVDGSTISANLGVNPALTITAQAERALALWPNAGQPDPRPDLGQPYRRLALVPPQNPALPHLS